jgi:dipeptidyl-peptidase-4
VTATDERTTWSYPSLAALTRRFSAGEPRTFTVAPDGESVCFLRAASAFDPVLSLWVVDLSGDVPVERLVVDAAAVLEGQSEDVPDAERRRRERLREVGGGITAYSCDAEVRRAAFTLSGELYVADLRGDLQVRRLGSDEGVIDPRMDPPGRRVAYSTGTTICAVDVESGEADVLASSEGDGRTIGLADFIAAEEFGRARGHWWSPDGMRLCFEVVDESDVEEVWIFDPASPQVEPRSRRYPRAGRRNARVSLVIAGPGGDRREVEWDRERFEYLVTVSWPAPAGGSAGGPLISLLSRDQRTLVVAVVDPATGSTTVLHEATDQWFVEETPGLPARTPDGRLVVAAVDHEADTYRLALVEGGVAEAFSPAGLQIAGVVDVAESGVLVVARRTATTLDAVEVGFDGTTTFLGDGSAYVRPLAGNSGGTVVTASTALDRTAPTFSVERPGSDRFVVRTNATGPAAAVPPVVPRPRLLEVGTRDLQVAVLFPSDPAVGGDRLPVIMSPYGGPHMQCVVEAGRAFAEEQYLADQGFCVVVADGRGTGGRGPAWDRAVWGVIGDVAVEDQVTALDGVMVEFGDLLDRSRVGIRGWSFGGYLAARCVLTRPDVFHAAVAGAPVTDWRWYDTGYTERYLGHPDEQVDSYEATSLLALAPRLERPLFFIHGYDDDNVLFCHTQLLSAALTAAGRPHRVVGLSGITHMAIDPEIAEQLVNLEVAFFREALPAA